MGLNADQLQAAMTALCAIEPAFAVAVANKGHPAPRISERGFATLLRTILGQQVSVASAQSVWNKLDALVGGAADPANIAAAAERGWHTHLFVDAPTLEAELVRLGLL